MQLFRFLQVRVDDDILANMFTDLVAKFEFHVEDIRKVADRPPEIKKDEYMYPTYDLITPLANN